jgi:hypothetical protein
MGRLEQELADMRKYLADLELLTYGHQKVNPHSFCIDDFRPQNRRLHHALQRRHHPELADYLKLTAGSCLTAA